jgi:hypothetical protein
VTVRYNGLEMVRAIAALLAFAALAAPARADVRALAPASFGAGPVLFGDRVLFGSPSVVSAPVAGGAAVPFGTVARDATLTAVPGLVAAAADGGLWTAGADGVFSHLASSLGSPPPFPVVPFVQATSSGVLAGDELFAGGRRLSVAVPPGGEYVAAAGSLGVAAVPDGTLVVFDLVSGIEQRQISLGVFDPVNLEGLAISPEGDVAATLPLGDGGDALVYARAGAERVRVLARGRGFGQVAMAGGRIAYVRGLQDGVQPVVVATSGRVVMRGPAGLDVLSLSFDGRVLAWRTPSCLFVGTSSSRSIPAGPCSRTVAVVDRLRGRRVRVACVNAVGPSCRVRVGGVARRVPRGRARVFAGQRVRLAA